MSDLPATLPRVPQGFTQRPTAILHKGTEGEIAVCSVHAPDGTKLPITYQYKTARSHDYERGYLIEGTDVVIQSWAELAAAWPAHVERLRAVTP